MEELEGEELEFLSYLLKGIIYPQTPILPGHLAVSCRFIQLFPRAGF